MIPERLLVLDQPTLLFTTAFVIGFTGLLLLVAQRPEGAVNPLLVWACAMFLGSLGLVVAVVGRDVPWIANGGATTLLLGAAATSWTASRKFTERPLLLARAAAGPVLWLVSIPVQSDSAGWTAVSCLIGAGYTLATAAEIARTRPEPLPSRTPALVLLLLHAAVYGLRGVDGALGTGRASNSFIDALILESLAHTVGMAFLLLAMVKERLELRSTEALRALARLDGLTGIGNRRMFDERLRMEIRRATRNGPALALLLIDVDRFKAYNDAVGHQMGDSCLRQVAQTIAMLVRRPGDLAARYGGEEFAVVLANTDLAGGNRIAETIRASLERQAIPHPGTGGVITVSIGVATLPEGAGPAEAEALVKRADEALYRAKAAGRNLVMSSGAPPDGAG